MLTISDSSKIKRRLTARSTQITTGCTERTSTELHVIKAGAKLLSRLAQQCTYLVGAGFVLLIFSPVILIASLAIALDKRQRKSAPEDPEASATDTDIELTRDGHEEVLPSMMRYRGLYNDMEDCLR